MSENKNDELENPKQGSDIKITENEPSKINEDEFDENRFDKVKTPSVVTKIPIEEPLSDFSDETYACDRDYAIVLAQLMSNEDRKKVYQWIERLNTINESDEMREERDMYLKYLIFSLSNGKLVPPFNKAPSPGLRPLSSVAPRSVHNHIFKGKYATGDCRASRPDIGLNTRYSLPDEIEPSLFFSRQPIPRNGGIVYAAAYSTNK